MLFFLWAVLFFSGCAKENPNPELLDPIYQDLLKDIKSKEADVKEFEKKIDELKKTVAKADTRDSDYKVGKKELVNNIAKMNSVKQSVELLKIKSERRRVEGRKSYRLAFHQHMPWPNPNEYREYLANKKLKTAGLNWEARVPKLSARNPNFAATQKRLKASKSNKKIKAEKEEAAE